MSFETRFDVRRERTASASTGGLPTIDWPMPLTSALCRYDTRWPGMYLVERSRLDVVFAPLIVVLHHVGSTAIPGLVAKPEIDILAVTDMWDEAWEGRLALLGYRRGGDLSRGHRFFKRDVGGVRTHKLHVCDEGHPMATQMLNFRDHLRRNADDCIAYHALKLRLEAENVSGIREYLVGKEPLIHAILDRVERGAVGP